MARVDPECMTEDQLVEGFKAAQSALRVIHTWAGVQIDFPDENVLDPKHVLEQCRRGLVLTTEDSHE